MIQQRICSLINSGTLYLQPRRFLAITDALYLNQKWRKEKGLPLNPNRNTILVGTPDYTFLDGRITPCGMRQTKRIQKQREFVKQIISLSKEVDFAVERNKQLHMDRSKQISEILGRKWKPKGVNLLKSK